MNQVTSTAFRWHDVDADPRGWDEHVERVRGSVFQRADVLGAHQFGRARRAGIVVSGAVGTAGIVGGMTELRDGGRYFESLHFPAALCSGAGVVREAIAWLGEQGYSGGSFGSFDGGVEGCDISDVRGSLTKRLEFIWNVQASDDDWMRAMRTQHRRNLKKALAAPMEFREVTRNRHWILTRLRAAWDDRRGLQSGWRVHLRRHSYHRHLEKWVGRTGTATLFAMYSAEGKPLSIAYVLQDAHMTFYMMGASSREGYEKSASVRLFWELAKSCRERGASCLSLGGVPAGAAEESHDEHGVFRFKAAFGLEPLPRTSLTFNCAAQTPA